MGSNGAVTASLLIITGTMGAGKTSVLAEASDILALRHVAHAAIDVDALGLALLPPGVERDAAMYGNLECVCKNYAALGVLRFMLARAIERRAELELVRSVAAAAKTVVCRLTASKEVMEQRVQRREPGVLQVKFVARVEELNAILDAARLEDFTVANEHRSLSDVALAVLFKAGWISKPSL